MTECGAVNLTVSLTVDVTAVLQGRISEQINIPLTRTTDEELQTTLRGRYTSTATSEMRSRVPEPFRNRNPWLSLCRGILGIAPPLSKLNYFWYNLELGPLQLQHIIAGRLATCSDPLSLNALKRPATKLNVPAQFRR